MPALCTVVPLVVLAALEANVGKHDGPYYWDRLRHGLDGRGEVNGVNNKRPDGVSLGSTT